MKFGPTNTADEDSENEAFEEILEDFGKIFSICTPACGYSNFTERCAWLIPSEENNQK